MFSMQVLDDGKLYALIINSVNISMIFDNKIGTSNNLSGLMIARFWMTSGQLLMLGISLAWLKIDGAKLYHTHASKYLRRLKVEVLFI